MSASILLGACNDATVGGGSSATVVQRGPAGSQSTATITQTGPDGTTTVTRSTNGSQTVVRSTGDAAN